MPEPRGILVEPGAGAPLTAAGGRLLASAAETGGGFTLIHSESPAGDQVPLHVHHSVDDAFYVLAGHYRVVCGADTFDAAPGAFVYLPRAVPHAYTVGDAPGTKLIIAVPGGIESFFAEMAEGLDPDEIGQRHGITMLEH